MLPGSPPTCGACNVDTDGRPGVVPYWQAADARIRTITTNNKTTLLFFTFIFSLIVLVALRAKRQRPLLMSITKTTNL
jgi:hypothetical protein